MLLERRSRYSLPEPPEPRTKVSGGESTAIQGGTFGIQYHEQAHKIICHNCAPTVSPFVGPEPRLKLQQSMYQYGRRSFSDWTNHPIKRVEYSLVNPFFPTKKSGAKLQDQLSRWLHKPNFDQLNSTSPHLCSRCDLRLDAAWLGFAGVHVSADAVFRITI